MEEQKQHENIRQKRQQNELFQKDKHCEHQYLNRKFGDLLVEVQFDDQLPIKLKSCVLGVDMLEHEQKSTIHYVEDINEHENPVLKHPHNHNSQPFAIISYHSIQNNKTLQLLIPLSHIMCVARKSSQTTLLMIKDKQKQIQLDQNGYQLVSDQDQDDVEQYVQQTNQLCEKIRKYVGQINTVLQSSSSQEQQGQFEGGQKMTEKYHHRTVVKVDCKCNIMLTPTVLQQNQYVELYNFLMHKLEQHEKIITQPQQNHAQQWRGQLEQLNSFKQMIPMQQQQGCEQQEQMEDQDYENDQEQDQQQQAEYKQQ